MLIMKIIEKISKTVSKYAFIAKYFAQKYLRKCDDK